MQLHTPRMDMQNTLFTLSSSLKYNCGKMQLFTLLGLEETATRNLLRQSTNIILHFFIVIGSISLFDQCGRGFSFWIFSSCWFVGILFYSNLVFRAVFSGDKPSSVIKTTFPIRFFFATTNLRRKWYNCLSGIVNYFFFRRARQSKAICLGNECRNATK